VVFARLRVVEKLVQSVTIRQLNSLFAIDAAAAELSIRFKRGGDTAKSS
jgi:hypothetical protein